MDVTDILLAVLVAAIGLASYMLRSHLRGLNDRLDRFEKRAQEDREAAERRAREDREAAERRTREDREAAERRAREDREAFGERTREDREAFGERAREDREAAERRAREDREANKNDHERLFAEFSDLKADVKVLRDRSDRSNSDS